MTEDNESQADRMQEDEVPKQPGKRAQEEGHPELKSAKETSLVRKKQHSPWSTNLKKKVSVEQSEQQAGEEEDLLDPKPSTGNSVNRADLLDKDSPGGNFTNGLNLFETKLTTENESQADIMQENKVPKQPRIQ